MVSQEDILVDPRKVEAVTKEENVGIYWRYIVYWDGSTRYFMEKNRMGENSAKIAKKYENHRYFDDFSIPL